MSLDPPTYLASLQNNIRQRPIPWDGQVRAGTLTDDQLAKIKAVERAKKDMRKEIVEADLDGYRILFVSEDAKPSVLELASKRHTEVVQYILVLLKDLLDGEALLCSVLGETKPPMLTIVCHSRPLALEGHFQEGRPVQALPPPPGTLVEP